jgi:NitT/TauT family transport system permease protein
MTGSGRLQEREGDAMTILADAVDGVRAAVGVEASRGRRRRGRVLGHWGPPSVVFLLFLGIWYLFSYVVLDADRRFLLPPPQAVIKVAFLDSYNRSQLLSALGLSTSVALTGLAVSIVLGMATAVLMSQARWIERSVYPYAVILQCIPTLALVPLIGFWFEFGYSSRVIVCVLISLFPIISSTFFGLQSADQEQHDLFTLRGAGRMTRLWKLQLPAAMPAVFTGFQVSATLAVVGAIVGDFFFKQGDAGIGILIDLYRARLQSEQLFGAVILASLLGVVVFWFFGFLTRRVVGGWYGSAAYTPPS